jgi:carbamoyl-phosphate synthase small subunit
MPKPRPDRWRPRRPQLPAGDLHATAPTACLALADGTLFYGHGFGATGMRVAELCFNTAMTGYQEIMTDPSYAGQIVTFTFPHIGNVGVNPEDDETADPVAEGMVVKWDPTEPSNWRAARATSSAGWNARAGSGSAGSTRGG